MGILINPKGRSLLHPEPLGRGASGHTVLEKQHLLNKMIVFQDALICFPSQAIIKLKTSFCCGSLWISWKSPSQILKVESHFTRRAKFSLARTEVRRSSLPCMSSNGRENLSALESTHRPALRILINMWTEIRSCTNGSFL